MNIFKKYGFVLGLSFVSVGAYAQGFSDPSAQPNFDEPVNKIWKPSLVKDGVIDKVPHVGKALDWANVRENDVAWSTKVWRQIDVREKQNQAFVYEGDEYTGGGAFIEILLDAVRKGKIQAYSMMDDRFTTALDLDAFNESLGGTWDTADVVDINTGEITQTITEKEFDINSVTKYRIKEEWVFDRNAGRLRVMIIGLAPIKDHYSPTTNEYLYSTPLFWLYYPDLRNVLVNYEVYNPKNNVNRITWTDYLDNRYFSSYIIKSDLNNVKGDNFAENSLRGLMEGQRIMDEIRNREDDMWQR